MLCRLDTLADTTFSCVCDMTETCRRHVANTTQNVAVWAKKRHADIRHVELSFVVSLSYKVSILDVTCCVIQPCYVHARRRHVSPFIAPRRYYCLSFLPKDDVLQHPQVSCCVIHGVCIHVSHPPEDDSLPPTNNIHADRRR